MAASAQKPVSSLAAALATQSQSPLKPRDAGHPGISQSLPSSANAKGRSGLPTPPNSLSPTLPPQKALSPSVPSAEPTPLETVDSEAESVVLTGEELENAKARWKPLPPLNRSNLSGLEAQYGLTSELLAKHHIPEFLIQNGPVPIRNIIAHCTQTVPGFSRLPPGRARRMVVAALEQRGGGGRRGDVIFEKFGWGKWDARYRGQPPRHISKSRTQGDDSVTFSRELGNGNSGKHVPIDLRAVGAREQSAESWPSEEMDTFPEHEADKMSLDGEEEMRPTRRIPVVHPPSDSDMTDEEDWESMGPEAVRVGSYAGSQFSRSRRGSQFSASSRARPIMNPSQRARYGSHGSNYGLSLSPDAARNLSFSAGITPFSRIVHSSSLSSSLRIMQGVSRRSVSASAGPASPAIKPTLNAIHDASLSASASKTLGSGAACDSRQEREAVEALLSLGGI
jgi:hypothetical protein